MKESTASLSVSIGSFLFSVVAFGFAVYSYMALRSIPEYARMYGQRVRTLTNIYSLMTLASLGVAAAFGVLGVVFIVRYFSLSKAAQDQNRRLEEPVRQSSTTKEVS